MASRALSCTHHNRFASKLLRVLHHPTASEATAERARCVSATTAVGPAPRCYITQQPTRIAVRGPLLVRNLTNNTAALLNQYTTNDDSTAAKSTEESDTTNTSRSQDSDTTNTTRSTDDSDSSTSSGSSSSEDDAEYASVDHIRRAILNASLNYVHEHGWTHAAIAKGELQSTGSIFVSSGTLSPQYSLGYYLNSILYLCPSYRRTTVRLP